MNGVFAHMPVFPLFLLRQHLKIMNGVFFYEIVILIKTKNINVCCFQVLTNQTNDHES